ncbi:MAG: DUF2793 domain-containing protein [Gammaproteobacteria bacterium]
MANTTNLMLPLLAAAQAQKHVTHNDAIQRLDAMVQLSAKDRHLTSPPGSPSDGDRYIPASGATGDWQDWDLNIAWYVDGVWTKLVPRGGWIAYVEDESLALIHDGSNWTRLPAASETWQVLAASAVAVSHSGDTAKTTLATVTVPAGAMGPSGMLRISSLWSHTASANSKTARVEFGGAQHYAGNFTTVASSRMHRTIANRGAANSQVAAPTSGAFNWGSTSDALMTSGIDTSVEQDLVFSGQLGDSAETIALESYLVELFHQA